MALKIEFAACSVLVIQPVLQRQYFVDYLEWKGLNLTSKPSIHPETIYYYLPHLRKNEDAIYPKVITGQSRTGAFLVIGISSVRRKKESYLMNTLNSLFNGISKYWKKNCVIIVLIAEVNSTYVNSFAGSIKRSFSNEVVSGALEVISPHESFYPDFSNLKETFGDSKERVRWRTKQNLDYSFLMMYAQKKGTYYLQLEDDIVANPQYLYTINYFIELKLSQEWIVLEFSQLGFIGKLFRCKDLPLIVEFFLMFYKDKPIDWLLDHLISVKVCNPEKNVKDCESQKSNLRIRYKPSLFQHVGFHSSLNGKIQQLRDEDFVETSLFREHVNPPAKMKTSLKVFQQFTLEKAYNGIEIFWAFTPKVGDYILFSFEKPLKIIRYLFRSGNFKHRKDILFNTTVEVLPSNDINSQTVRNNSNHTTIIKTWDGFFQIDNFEDGVAEGAIPPFLGKIKALRLFIHSNSSKWILLNEIFIQT
ncbi:LOW QUALITY PROTEIN: alpha-1,3-mannosyl-glycoprotein 4-beta-N-acetylglucosaminyltransferase-like protein MGAT4D [Thamnophis elegans]|uniref:LOW QUALITY PROTEIN: alpha-1,3-mannosyl-glycoprotein 4-beta-N-acetylglucosaminyltransferase-like protein MGAT4D n=1 Tax=Thamnophis elegans TaxID=35005 RepID=UPI0013776D38|nr:LOW QUALITY PROTEIN: alpha-1,3-mannosyl-glycoprotein 4-beta-N-acetylglucosaminyltransferase-like protein MGAT4D [Thamnophis elegans]